MKTWHPFVLGLVVLTQRGQARRQKEKMLLGQPDPNQPQGAPPGAAGMIPMLLKILAGAGLKNLSKSTTDFASVGADIKPILDDPMTMAGVGLEALGVPPDMLMSFLKPPAPPPEAQQPQIPIQALLPALTAKLGPGRTGLQAGPGAMPPPSTGLPPMGMGPGGPPMGAPSIPPPPVLGGM